MAVRFSELLVDAVDPPALARWWGAALGWPVTEDDDEGTEIADPGGTGPKIVFVPVPEPKTVKNRLHIDLSPVGVTQAEELRRLLGLGATLVDVGQPETVSWIVLADPEGNELCLLRG